MMGTFEAYCRERWGFTVRRAYQIIGAAEVAGNVNNCSQTAPTTESQARPLSKLPPAEQPAAWQEATDKAAAEVTGNVQKITQTAPATESHALPLSKLPPAEQPAAWQEATDKALRGRRPPAHADTRPGARVAV